MAGGSAVRAACFVAAGASAFATIAGGSFLAVTVTGLVAGDGSAFATTGAAAGDGGVVAFGGEAGAVRGALTGAVGEGV